VEKSKRLRIENYYTEDLQVAANAAFRDDDNAQLQPRVTTDFHTFLHADEHDRFAVSLTIKSEEPVTEEHPVRFAIRIVGFFRVEEPIVDGKLPPGRVINALTILYGVARGQIDTAAGWFHHQILLPTVYFSDVVAARIASAKREEIEEHVPPQLEAGASV
jgi:preprotein translocase subunit SecB